MSGQLAKMVRDKYPGSYDDMDDASLEAAIVAKFPGVYDDLVAAPAPPTTQPSQMAPPTTGERIGGVPGQVVDAGIGALKGVGNTVFGAGKVLRDYTPLGYAADAIAPGAFDKRPDILEPKNTAQRVGYTAEQVGEFFVPAIKLAKLGRAGEVAKSAALTLAQTGSPVAATTSGAISAIPGGKVMQWATGKLEDSALKGMAQALGARKERFKAIADRIAPEMLKRGVRGSQESMKTQAEEGLEIAAERLDDAMSQFADQRVPAKAVLDALEEAKAPFQRKVFNPKTGADDRLVVFDARPIGQLTGLQKVVADLGPSPTVEQITALRRAWDSVVAQAGGYAQRAPGAIGVPLKDQSEAWAKREGAGAIRKLLSESVPDLAAVNKEYAFWKSLDDVLTQTLQRTQPHQKGKLAEMAGQAAGAATGISGGAPTAIAGAFAVGKLTKMLNNTVNSPRWATYSAAAKQKLADAIMSGSTTKVADALFTLSKSAPAVASQR